MTRTTAVIISLLLFTAACSNASSETAAPGTPVTQPPATQSTTTTAGQPEVSRVIPSEPVVVVTTAAPDPTRDTTFFEDLPEPFYDVDFLVQDTPPGGLWEIPTDPAEIAELETEIAARYELATLMIAADIEAHHKGEESPFEYNLQGVLTQPFSGRYARNKLRGLTTITEYPDVPIYPDFEQVHVRMLPDLWPWGVAELWVCRATNTVVTRVDSGEVVREGDRDLGIVARMRFVDGAWKYMGHIQSTDWVPHMEEGGCWNRVPDPYY